MERYSMFLGWKNQYCENDCATQVLVTQSCPSLCNPMDYSLQGSSVHGILQARILKWVAIPFSRESSQPMGRTQVPTLQADSLPT